MMQPHIHDWINVYRNGCQVLQQCLLCGLYRSTMYDMVYGCTYWEKGWWWQDKDKASWPESTDKVFPLRKEA